MSNVNLIGECQKEKFVEHLIKEVAQGISGRDMEEIVDTSPSRVLFAGVLQAPRRVEAATAGNAGPDAVPPASTSLGLDFRISASSGKLIKLKVTPRWSFYYPVFPTFEQALFANPSVTQKSNQQTQITDGSITVAQPLNPENSPEQLEATSGNAVDEGEEDEEELPGDEKAAGTVSLPRVFRRCDVRPDRVTIDLSREDCGVKHIGSSEIAVAISSALLLMRNETRLWKHLSTPSDAERRLGDFSTLASNDIYQSALQRRSSVPVDLPPWSAAIQIDVSQDTERPDTLRIQVLLSNTTSEAVDFDGDRLLEDRSIFDAGLVVEIDGAEIVPFDFLLAPKDYRSQPQMAAGV